MDKIELPIHYFTEGVWTGDYYFLEEYEGTYKCIKEYDHGHSGYSTYTFIRCEVPMEYQKEVKTLYKLRSKSDPEDFFYHTDNKVLKAPKSGRESLIEEVNKFKQIFKGV